MVRGLNDCQHCWYHWRYEEAPGRLYKAAAFILRDFREGKDSVKSLVFATKQTQFGGKSRPKHPNTKALFALVSNAVNHMSEVEAVISKMDLFALEPKLHKELGMVLITELVWGKGELPQVRTYVTIQVAHNNEHSDLRPERSSGQGPWVGSGRVVAHGQRQGGTAGTGGQPSS